LVDLFVESGDGFVTSGLIGGISLVSRLLIRIQLVDNLVDQEDQFVLWGFGGHV